jgi:hypothetical protein
MLSHFSVWKFLSRISTPFNLANVIHAIPNFYIKVSHTFTVMCLKYSPPNILNIVGTSITLAPHINMQHSVVSYEILHKYLFLFSIAKCICVLRKATTACVTRMQRSCGLI